MHKEMMITFSTFQIRYRLIWLCHYSSVPEAKLQLTEIGGSHLFICWAITAVFPKRNCSILRSGVHIHLYVGPLLQCSRSKTAAYWDRGFTSIYMLGHYCSVPEAKYSKYAKVARMHYFCTIALRTSRAVLTWAWASRRVDLFSKQVIIFCC